MDKKNLSTKKGPNSDSLTKNRLKEIPAKPKSEIHVVSVPHEDDIMAEEMAELFEEDQVTHKHGSAEPEGD